MSDAVTDAGLRGLSGYRLQRANGVAALRYREVFARHGLRRTTFSCLCLIVDHPGLRQSQLGATLAIERPNLVQIVDDLCQQGLVERQVSTKDRRAYALRPTAAGRDRFTRAKADVAALDSRMTEGMSAEDIAQFNALLDRVQRNAARLGDG